MERLALDLQLRLLTAMPVLPVASASQGPQLLALQEPLLCLVPLNVASAQWAATVPLVHPPPPSVTLESIPPRELPLVPAARSETTACLAC